MTDEQKKLITDNHQLIYSFLHRYEYDPEEYYDLAAIGLCNAARLYDESKGAFSTYAYKAMLNAINRELIFKSRTKRIPEHLIISYDCETCNEEGEVIDFLSLIPSTTNIEKEVLAKVTVESYMDELNDRDRLVLVLLEQGFNTIEISKIIGVSRTTIRKIRDRFIVKFGLTR